MILAAVAPPIAPPLVVQVAGQGGQWFGPILVLSAALALDWSALGSSSWRDVIASWGYYAATVSIVAIEGWAGAIQGWFGSSPSWQLTGSAISTVMQAMLILAMVGARIDKTKALAKRVHKMIHMHSADSDAVRINSTLLTFSALAGMSVSLARGPSIWLPQHVALVLTGVWSWIASVIAHYLGG